MNEGRVLPDTSFVDACHYLISFSPSALRGIGITIIIAACRPRAVSPLISLAAR